MFVYNERRCDIATQDPDDLRGEAKDKRAEAEALVSNAEALEEAADELEMVQKAASETEEENA